MEGKGYETHFHAPSAIKAGSSALALALGVSHTKKLKPQRVF